MRPEPQLFVELTEGLPRQGPGSDECTRRALSMVPERASISRILDSGCGPGAQTLVLAQGTEAQIIALDLRSRFLNELRGRAVAAGVSERVSLVCGSMADAGFRDSSFDLIWSEGAIYIVGLERGLRDWSRLLKHGRCIVVSEATWLVANPPAEPAEFWKQHYPGMKSIDENLECAERAGYGPLGHFTVSSEDWWKNYYFARRETPVEAALEVRRRCQSHAHTQRSAA